MHKELEELDEQFKRQAWHEMNCIESFTLNHFFKSVYVGQELKGRIETAKRKMYL